MTRTHVFLRQHFIVLQEGERTIHNIPPGPLIRFINQQLAEMYANGIRVEDAPVFGPTAMITVFPKCILRIADFPGPHGPRVRKWR